MRTVTKNLMAAALALTMVNTTGCLLEPGAELASERQALDKQDPEPEVSIRNACRIARIAELRRDLVAGSLAMLGASDKEQTLARSLMSQRAKEVCDGQLEKSPARTSLEQLIVQVEDRFAKETILESGHGLFGQVLLDELHGFERRCFSKDAVELEKLIGMSDKEFEASLPTLAYGSCGGAGGGIGGGPSLGGIGSVPGAAGSYSDCVRDGLRADLDRHRDSCNLAGGDPPDGEPDVDPEPQQGGGETTEEGGETTEGGETDSGGTTDADTNESGPSTGDRVAGAVEVAVGVAGVFVGGVIVIEAVLAAPETAGLSLLQVPAGTFLINQGLSWIRSGSRRFEGGRLCPSLSSPAGVLGFASNPVMGGTDHGQFSVSDVLRTCRCQHEESAIPDVGGLGDSCSGDRKDRLDCLRNPNGGTDVMRPECARMLADDNKSLLDARFGLCASISCGDDLVLDADCGCVNMGGPGGSSGYDACKLTTCAPGSMPVPTGFACVCQDDLGGTGGFDLGGSGWDLSGGGFDWNGGFDWSGSFGSGGGLGSGGYSWTPSW